MLMKRRIGFVIIVLTIKGSSIQLTVKCEIRLCINLKALALKEPQALGS